LLKFRNLTFVTGFLGVEQRKGLERSPIEMSGKDFLLALYFAGGKTPGGKTNSNPHKEK
jgi:hypothetical protein